MPPYSGPRATGPFVKQRPGRATLYIVRIHGADGRRTDASYSTEAEACQVRDDFNVANRREEVSTVEAAVAAYLAHKRVVDECKASTVDTTEFRLKALIGPVYDVACDRLTKAQAAKLYEKRYAAVKTDTHRNELAETRRFFAWAVKKRFVRGNPFGDVEAVGRRAKGKVQLHVDEARKFLAHAFAVAGSRDLNEINTDAALARGAVAALCALLLAMRASEIVGLRVRDVDDEGRLLWVAEEDGKTAAARRAIRVPDQLAELLAQLLKGRDGSEPLWHFRHNRRWPLGAVKRLCEEAKVPEVTAHGLRGTLATLARAEGANLIDLVKLLGHTSSSITEGGSYVKKGTGAAEARARGFNVIMGGKR